MRTWVPILMGVVTLVLVFVLMEFLFPEGCSRQEKPVQTQGPIAPESQPSTQPADPEEGAGD